MRRLRVGDERTGVWLGAVPRQLARSAPDLTVVGPVGLLCDVTSAASWPAMASAARHRRAGANDGPSRGAISIDAGRASGRRASLFSDFTFDGTERVGLARIELARGARRWWLSHSAPSFGHRTRRIDPRSETVGAGAALVGGDASRNHGDDQVVREVEAFLASYESREDDVQA